MADGAEASSVAPVEGSSNSSGKHCSSCRKPVKDHVGPHGKDRCGWSVVETLRLRVVELEKLVAVNQERHAEDISSLEARYVEDLARSDKLHQQRTESLLVLVESLQGRENAVPIPAVDRHRSADKVALPADQKDAIGPSEPENSQLESMPEQIHPSFAKIVSSNDNGGITLSSIPSASPASSSSPNSETTREGEFIEVRKKRTLRTGLRPNRTVRGGDLTSSGTLRGSKRVRTKCYFVSGVSPDSTEEQIRSYCNKRFVQTTGCYLLRSRNWGTQSAKLFVAADCSDTVEQTDFWPEFIHCRPWIRDPPGPSHRIENGETQ